MLLCFSWAGSVVGVTALVVWVTTKFVFVHNKVVVKQGHVHSPNVVQAQCCFCPMSTPPTDNRFGWVCVTHGHQLQVCSATMDPPYVTSHPFRRESPRHLIHEGAPRCKGQPLSS